MATSKAKDLADFIAKQSTDDDSILETGAMQLPAGTTSERPTAVAGMIRYNSTIGKAEQYDGTSWQAIDSPPTITSVSPDNFDTAGDSITITGSNFSSDCTVTFINNSGSSFASATLTRNSTSSLTATVSSSMVSDDDDPYDVKVTNGSGLAATLENALDFAPEPVFATASGTLGTITDSIRSSYSLSPVTATSTESDATLTYALGSGDSLPAGLSLNASTGAITGTATAVGSNTTTTFDIVATATDGDSNVTTNTRSFSITVNSPVITSYTSIGSGTFSVPTGVTAVDVLVVGGGGGGGTWVGSGAGAGGLIYRPAFPVTPGGSVSYTVGSGGGGAYNNGSYSDLYDTVTQFSQRGQEAPNAAKIGQDSSFGTLTALGGGRGGSYGGDQNGHNATQGGSGGGQPARSGSNTGQGIQSQQPGDSGTYGFGNAGGQVTGNIGSPDYFCAGGGGAGGAAENVVDGVNGNPDNRAGDAGIGKQYDISGSQVYYAGGGGGGVHGDSAVPTSEQVGGQGGSGGGGDGGGAGGPSHPQHSDWDGKDGTANRGGGGGAGGRNGGQASAGGTGGSGIVIVKY